VTVDLTEAGLVISSVRLSVEATVPGVDDAAFQEAAKVAKDGCPVSRALAGVPSITLEATLR
jgi:osmotically inducible protein OsmC